MSDMRSQLLDTAARLFAERGYKAVSMRDIAKLVGVTQANLYYHFRDKADLIEATLASVFEARAQELDAWLARHPSNQIEAFVRWFVQMLMTEIGRAPSELQSLMRISYAVFCWTKKNKQNTRY